MEETEPLGWLMVVFGLNVTVRCGREDEGESKGGDGGRALLLVLVVVEVSNGDDSVAEDAILVASVMWCGVVWWGCDIRQFI